MNEHACVLRAGLTRFPLRHRRAGRRLPLPGAALLKPEGVAQTRAGRAHCGGDSTRAPRAHLPLQQRSPLHVLTQPLGCLQSEATPGVAWLGEKVLGICAQAGQAEGGCMRGLARGVRHQWLTANGGTGASATLLWLAQACGGCGV